MRTRRPVLAAIVLLATFALPAAAAGVVRVDDPAREDIDVRRGSIAPTAAQREAARTLGALVTWNRFGTPSSLVAASGALATGVPGATAVEAARAWLDGEAALFRLSSAAGLEVAADSPLARSDAHAVTFRQRVGGLDAVGGGTVTVGVAPAAEGWRIVSATSTISGDESLAGGRRIGTERALRQAVAGVSRRRTLAQISPAAGAGVPPGWDAFRVAGFDQPQRVRAAAFPTVRDGYVPAYEALVVDATGVVPLAERVIVEARTGRILVRENLVRHQTQPPDQGPTFEFSGELPAEDGACDARKGPYTVEADAGVRAVDVFANADTPEQDIVLRLYRGDELLVEADMRLTPEQIRYEPAGGVPPGDYFVQVCEFADGAPPVEPRTYTGTVHLDTSPPPEPYLARWRAFPAYPPLAEQPADPWGIPSTDTRQTWCWRPAPDPAACDHVVDNLASRAPWDHDPPSNEPTRTTVGNNAVTAEAWEGTARFTPSSPTRDYTFAWTNAWANADCNPGDPYGSAFAVGESFDIAAAVTNLFVSHNRLHDWTYRLGFTEENWNAQASNFGRTEPSREDDRLLGLAQAAAAVPPPDVYLEARNNAFMVPLPDGTMPFSAMFLFQPLGGRVYVPCTDSAFDMTIIGHEYAHLVENRMVGKGSPHSGFHAGAMGEGIGDLLVAEYLQEYGFVPQNGENPWASAAYTTGNRSRGGRNYAANYPRTGAFPAPGALERVNPLHFGDIGYDMFGPEVHSDGEIWIAANYDVRAALNAKYDAAFPAGDTALQRQCADGVLPPDRCPGNRRWVQLMLDSFLLQSPEPSMVEARNAMLAADQLRFGGANADEIWLAFARRGLGTAAAASTAEGRTGGVESDTDPLPDFASARHPSATVRFVAVSRQAGDPPVRARIHVGRYEARVSPVADTDPGTSAPEDAPTDNLDDTAQFAPGTYEFVANAPGYGHVRFRRALQAGTSQTITLRFARNWASTAHGAVASGDVAPIVSTSSEPPGAEIVPAEQVLRNLIDDSEATMWQAAATEVDGAWTAAGRQVTVDLAGDARRTIRGVKLSALVAPVFDPGARPDPTDQFSSPFTALRQFELLACDATRADCASDAGFTSVYTSPANAFPAEVPGPTASDLYLRSFDIPPTPATHLRLRVLSTQCTGEPAFQGEQDADPFNATDCDTAARPALRFVRVSEFEAFTGGTLVGEAQATQR